MAKIRLRELRKEKGISMRELAKRSRVSKSYISAIENGESSPTVDIIANCVER